MALQVWLPLTKDLRQQGLSNVAVTNNGATFNSAGKLGGCYSFNASGYLKETSIDWTNFNTSEFSLCCWYKEPSPVASGNSQMICIGTSSGWNNIRIGLLRRTSNGYPMFSVSDGSNNVNYNFTANSFSLDTWNHIVCTYNNGTMKMYLNGELHKTYTTTIVPVLNSSQHLGIGAASNGAEPLTGYLNDVRIYDHCLSPMEVKELAKGLVLHYPLDRQGWGQENLVTGSNTNSLSTNNWAIGSQTGGNTRTIEQDETGTYCVKFVRDSTTQSGWYYLSYGNLLRNQIKTDTTYTLTFDCKASVNSSITFTGLLNGNATNYMTNATTNIQSSVVANQWCHMKYQCKTISSFDGITIGSQVVYLAPQAALKAVGVTVYFKNIKLEEGEIATPWCPNSSDTLATTMGLNSTIEYDCSGYCNNGEKIGTLTYTSDTPKYAVSTHIDATTTKIHISNLSTSGFGNSYSFAWWAKISSVTPMHWGFSDGIRLNGMYTGRLWNTGDGSNNPLYNIDTTTQVTAPTTNVWHHWVMTGNGTKCYVYQDGELWAEAKTYKAISGTSIYINGWNNATDYSSNNYSISDFRIYATALSADDVKSLYQNSAYIDSSGNVYGAVHLEV